ncbi:MAG: recombinase family protein [Microbacterium ginsengisoli]|nr:recombinase family protein [Microbacterium ginsengisoli]
MKLGYARVSTAQQDHARQLAALEAAGCEKVFTDKWTGDSALRGRSGGSELMQHARAGDRIVVTELARAGRRPAQLLSWLDQLSESGIEFESLSEGIVIVPGESNPLGRLLVHLLAAVAELERSVLLARAAAGREEAMKKGVRFGRPEKLTASEKAKLVRLYRASLADGMTATASARETGRTFGVSERTVWRVVREAEQKAGAAA